MTMNKVNYEGKVITLRDIAFTRNSVGFLYDTVDMYVEAYDPMGHFYAVRLRTDDDNNDYGLAVSVEKIHEAKS